MSKKLQEEYYQAVLNKDSQYEGSFFVGVKTTGVFCRPTCPARKPKFENCEFFDSAASALQAGYRACKRCKPLLHPNHSSDLVTVLLAAVHANPARRWSEADFQAFGVDASTVRRQFKRRFGVTFIQYARARRLGLAKQLMSEGVSVIDAQLGAGYESGSGFRESFSKLVGVAPSKSSRDLLRSAFFDTPLGPMLGISDDRVLYLLEFVDRAGLATEVARLQNRLQRSAVPDFSLPLEQLGSELVAYFDGTLSRFETPVSCFGTVLERAVWQVLKAIPLGEVCSYEAVAVLAKQASSVSEVAQASVANRLAIVVPCHRVFWRSGELGDYGGGVARKRWLVNHERKVYESAG